MAGILDGTVVLVTGATGGLGRGMVKIAAAEGAYVAAADLDDDAGHALTAEVGERCRYFHLDVTSAADWSRVVDDLTQSVGPVTGLVNNAAIVSSDGGPADFSTMPVEVLRQVFEVNVVGGFLGTQAVAAGMKAAGGGSIVNVSSIGGLRAVEGFGAYATSKFAIRGLTRAFALELGPHNIRVNSLHPGHINTPMRLRALAEDTDLAAVDRARPLRRGGTPEEVANLTCFLLSERSSYCTGAEFIADGGLLAGAANPKPRKA